jgi:hypothetical protein
VKDEFSRYISLRLVCKITDLNKNGQCPIMGRYIFMPCGNSKYNKHTPLKKGLRY